MAEFGAVSVLFASGVPEFRVSESGFVSSILILFVSWLVRLLDESIGDSV